MNDQRENVLPRVRSDVLDAPTHAFPDPGQSKAEFMEAETTDESGRRLWVRYYKFTLRAHQNTWHMWCPDFACYLDD